MMRFFRRLLGGRLLVVLVVSFVSVSALTVGLGAAVISRVINDYMANAEADRVERDMVLAKAFYQLKLDEVAAISYRLVLDIWVQQNFPGAKRHDPEAIRIIDQQIVNKITVLALGGTHFIAVMDNEGNILVGRVLDRYGNLSSTITQGNWGQLPIVQAALSTGREQKATEVIPSEFLSQVGLAEQAYIPLQETPLAAPTPYDPREGTAGLAMVGVRPLRDAEGR
ncbi:MAG: hypothetical protein ACP5TV_05070, partial [Anaerolineae bacterium]